MLWHDMILEVFTLQYLSLWVRKIVYLYLLSFAYEIVPFIVSKLVILN